MNYNDPGEMIDFLIATLHDEMTISIEVKGHNIVFGDIENHEFKIVLNYSGYSKTMVQLIADKYIRVLHRRQKDMNATLDLMEESALQKA